MLSNHGSAAFVLLAVSCIAASAWAQPYSKTFAPTADCYVQSALPGTSNNSGQFRVGAAYEAYLNFDSTFSTVPRGATVTAVELTLKRDCVTGANGSQNIAFGRINSSWNESATWSTRPTNVNFSPVVAFGVQACSTDDTLAFASASGLVNWAQAVVNNGSHQGIAMVGNGTTNIWSRESGSSLRPSLRIRYDAPQLYPNALTVSNPAPVVGESVTVQFVVRNEGTKASNAGVVRLYTGLSSCPSTGTSGAAQEWSVPSVSASGVTSFYTRTLTFNTPGTYRVHVLADATNTTAEEDESDNCREVVVTVLGPLAINPLLTSVSATADVGGTLAATYVITNPNTVPVDACLGFSMYLGSNGAGGSPNYNSITPRIDIPAYQVTLQPGVQTIHTDLVVPPDNPSLHANILAGPYTVRMNAKRSVGGACGAAIPEDDAVELNAAVKVRRPRFGTTIITHGFAFFGTQPDWPLSMAKAIVDRSGRDGTILQYEPTTGLWRSPSGLEPRYAVAPGTASGERVLLFSWPQDSNNVIDGTGVYGFGPAAGDALFAALADPYAGLSSGDTPIAGLLTLGVHFIGHSRGCVVNSEASRRLFAAGFRPAEAKWLCTMLDPHPVNGQWTNNDGGNPDWGDPLPQRWSQFDFVDDYYQSNDSSFDFDGLAVPGAAQFALDQYVDPSPNCIQGGDHTLVHTWYHGTIDPSAMSDGSGSGSCEAVSRNVYYPANIQGGMGIGYAYSGVAGAAHPPNEGPHTQAAINSLEIFNGDMQAGINGSVLSPSLAGWYFHGGGGVLADGSTDRQLWSSDGLNRFARLGNTINSSGNPATRLEVRHNRIYVPPSATHLAFQWHSASASDDTLSVYLTPMGQASLRSIYGPASISSTNGWREHSAIPIPPELRGHTCLLSFVFRPTGFANATVDIDAVRFATPTCTADVGRSGGIAGSDGALDNNDFIVFISYFFANDSRADRGRAGGLPGADGRFDNNDFIVFINQFFAGCQ